MRTIVMALKAIGYKKTIKLLSVEETIEWNRMVSSATLEQHEPFSKKEDSEWSCLVAEVQINASKPVFYPITYGCGHQGWADGSDETSECNTCIAKWRKWMS